MTNLQMSGDALSPFSRSKLAGADALLKAVVREKPVKAGSDVLRHADVPKAAHVLLDGHAYRYTVLNDGRRQITAILVRGDVCDLGAVMRGRAEYSVGALTNCVLGEIPAEEIADPAALDREMTGALWRRLLRDEAISREWLVGMGRRTASERAAHLLCELRVRMDDAGLASDTTFEMEFTQSDLADVLGLSTVHVNRTLQELRRAGLIQTSNGRMTILDYAALAKMAGFDPTYLRMA